MLLRRDSSRRRCSRLLWLLVLVVVVAVRVLMRGVWMGCARGLLLRRWLLRRWLLLVRLLRRWWWRGGRLLMLVEMLWDYRRLLLGGLRVLLSGGWLLMIIRKHRSLWGRLLVLGLKVLLRLGRCLVLLLLELLWLLDDRGLGLLLGGWRSSNCSSGRLGLTKEVVKEVLGKIFLNLWLLLMQVRGLLMLLLLGRVLSTATIPQVLRRWLLLWRWDIVQVVSWRWGAWGWWRRWCTTTTIVVVCWLRVHYSLCD
jgi:hypothetical protein